jgi:chromosome segregation ATPase
VKKAKIWLAVLVTASGIGAIMFRVWTTKRPDQIETATHETEELRQQMRDSHDRLSSEIDSFGDARVRLTQRISEVDEQSTRLEKRLEHLGRYVDRAGERMRTIDDLKSSMARTAERVSSSQQRTQSVIDGIEDQYRRLESQVKTLGELLHNMQSIGSQVRKGQLALTKRNDTLDEVLAGLASSTNHVSDQTQSLGSFVDDIQAQGRRLESLNESVEKHSSDLSELTDELTTHALNLPEQQNQFNADRNRVLADIGRLAQTATVYETSKQELTDEVSNGRATTERLEDRLSSIEDRLSEEQDKHRQTKSTLLQEQATRKNISSKLEAANAANAHLEQRIAELDSVASAPQQTETLEWRLKPVPKTFDELVESVRSEFRSSVSLPSTAIKDIDEFKSIIGVSQLAADAWRAIGALHEYATLDPPFNGNFYDWCRYSGHAHAYPIGDVALNESETTKNSKNKDKYSREFYVDTQVSRSGKIAMYAHVKFGGVGQNRPRLFFHDDTGGNTGKIHIGFLGPHNEVKNASSN